MAALKFVMIDDFQSALKVSQRRLEVLPGDKQYLMYSSAQEFLNAKQSGALNEAKPDIIICDSNMPGMSGLDLLRKIKTDPSYNTIPFVLLSADVKEAEAIEAKTLGATIAEKPLNVELISKALSKKQIADITGEIVSEAQAVVLSLQSALEKAQPEKSLEFIKQMHTLKGVFFLLEFEWLGLLVHDLESVCQRFIKVDELFHPLCVDVLSQSLEYFADQLEKVSQKRTLELMPEKLKQSIKVILDAPEWAITKSQGAAQVDQKQEKAETNVDFEVFGNTARVAVADLEDIAFHLIEFSKTLAKIDKACVASLFLDPHNETLLEIQGLIGHSLVQSGRLNSRFLSLRMQKAEKLEQIANNIFQMSLRTTTEKSPHFSVSVTQDFSIDRVVVEKLSQVLPILFSNSFEHAFKSPLLNRKPEISLSLANPTDNRIELLYSDNGPGIDVKKLRSRALQLRPEMVELLSAWSDDEALQLIFLDQFSMAAELTPAAGRGVGLSVVKSELDKVGGRVRVSQDENGLHFLIQCPQWSAL